MQETMVMPIDMKVLMNHIYEFKKGVRQMILFTFNKKYETFALERLKRQNIDSSPQPAYPRGGLYARRIVGV